MRRFLDRLWLFLVVLASCARAPVRGPDDPMPQAEAFLRAWERGDLALVRQLLVGAPPDLEARLQRFKEELRVVSTRLEPQGSAGGAVSFRATHLLRGLGPWTYEGALTLVRHGGAWRVAWSPALLHPLAREGARFVRTRARPPRAEILDGRGDPLTHLGEVIAIGVDPARVVDPDALADRLHAQLGLEPARVQRALQGRGGFQPLVELRPERYQVVRPSLAPEPGIFFRKRPGRLSPWEGFAAETLGRVGEITSELLGRLGPLYQVGDAVGLSGLELAFEAQLAGAPSGEIRLVQPGGESTVLHTFEGEPGAPLRTTLLPEVQRAAERALEGLDRPAALVAIESATGAVLAVANLPGGELNRALAGRYPPGSTFKVVTAEALLEGGLSADAQVGCPPQLAVGGKLFRNFEGESFPRLSFRLAFAHSCNTAFIAAARTLAPGALAEASRRFGFDVPYAIGLPTAGASAPIPSDEAERAATAIGQGRVLATPLHLASVAAAVESGTWRAPHLVVDLDEGPTASLERAAPLRELMRAVVTEGTGQSAGGALSGKTGTAEYGTGKPLPTHAWFIGFREGVSFAVLVEGGGAGGRVAAPIAARFAAALGR